MKFKKRKLIKLLRVKYIWTEVKNSYFLTLGLDYLKINVLSYKIVPFYKKKT